MPVTVYREIAQNLPENNTQLLEIDQMTQIRVQKYGAVLLEVCTRFREKKMGMRCSIHYNFPLKHNFRKKPCVSLSAEFLASHQPSDIQTRHPCSNEWSGHSFLLIISDLQAVIPLRPRLGWAQLVARYFHNSPLAQAAQARQRSVARKHEWTTQTIFR